MWKTIQELNRFFVSSTKLSSIETALHEISMLSSESMELHLTSMDVFGAENFIPNFDAFVNYSQKLTKPRTMKKIVWLHALNSWTNVPKKQVRRHPWETYYTSPAGMDIAEPYTVWRCLPRRQRLLPPYTATKFNEFIICFQCYSKQRIISAVHEMEFRRHLEGCPMLDNCRTDETWTFEALCWILSLKFVLFCLWKKIILEKVAINIFENAVYGNCIQQEPCRIRQYSSILKYRNSIAYISKFKPIIL